MSRVLPILFNTDMVQAILDGRKTVTRRIIKDCIINNDQEINKNPRGEFELYNITPRCGIPQNIFFTPKYQVGDILYVRETWCWCPCWDCGMDSEEGCCDKAAEKFYNAERGEYGCYGYRASFKDNEQPFDKWHPSIHMPKEATRIWLKVTNVRAERLQDITEREAEKEGFCDDAEYCVGNTARGHFSKLWDSTIKKTDISMNGWNANPWVWVIEFERCEKPQEVE